MEGWDKDLGTDDSLGEVRWERTASSDPTWITLSHTFGYGGYYEIQYRFTCSSNYYGRLCTEYCLAQDNGYGHYTCSSSGTKDCRSGWTGTDCNVGTF